MPSDAIARGDGERVQQVLLNLLSNAMKFTEPGGEVVIETSVSDYTVRIDVRDTGSGIESAQREAIFEPFVQVDASLTRTAGGAGSTFTLALPHADQPVLALYALALSHSPGAGQVA